MGLGAIAGALLGGRGGAARRALGGSAMAVLGAMALNALSEQEPAGRTRCDERRRTTPASVFQEDLESMVTPQVQGLLVRAMIFAAKADGQIDQEEVQRIMGKIGDDGVTDEERREIADELARPLDLQGLIAAVPDEKVAAQIYGASLLSIDIETASNTLALAVPQGLGDPAIQSAVSRSGPDGIRNCRLSGSSTGGPWSWTLPRANMRYTMTGRFQPLGATTSGPSTQSASNWRSTVCSVEDLVAAGKAAQARSKIRRTPNEIKSPPLYVTCFHTGQP